MGSQAEIAPVLQPAPALLIMTEAITRLRLHLRSIQHPVLVSQVASVCAGRNDYVPRTEATRWLSWTSILATMVSNDTVGTSEAAFGVGPQRRKG